MTIEFKHLAKPSFINILLYVLVGVLLWGISYIGSYSFLENNSISDAALFPQENLIINIIVLGITLLNAVLIAQFLRIFSLVTTGSLVGSIVFFLLITVWKNTHIDYAAHTALILFIFSLFQFFSLSNSENPSEKAFLGCIFIGIASLLIRELLFVLPIIWIGLIMLHSLNFRTFLATIFGLITPLLFFFAINYFFYTPIAFSSFFDYSHIGFYFQNYSLIKWIYIGFLSLILIILIITSYADYSKKSIHARRYINFILLMLIFFSVISIISKKELQFLPFIALFYAVFFAHSFSSRRNNFYSILLITFCFVNILMIFYEFFLK